MAPFVLSLDLPMPESGSSVLHLCKILRFCLSWSCFLIHQWLCIHWGGTFSISQETSPWSLGSWQPHLPLSFSLAPRAFVYSIEIPELYTYLGIQRGVFFCTKLLNDIVVMPVWCPGERDVKLHCNSLLGETWHTSVFISTWNWASFASRPESDRVLQGSQLRHSTCFSSAWDQNRI